MSLETECQPRCVSCGEGAYGSIWFWVRVMHPTESYPSSIDLICSKCAMKHGVDKIPVGWLSCLSYWEVGPSRRLKCKIRECDVERDCDYNNIPEGATIVKLYYKLSCHDCSSVFKPSRVCLGECVCLSCAGGKRGQAILCANCGMRHKDQGHVIIWRKGLSFSWAMEMVDNYVARVAQLKDHAEAVFAKEKAEHPERNLRDYGEVNIVAKKALQCLNPQRIKRLAQRFMMSDNLKQPAPIDMIMWLFQLNRSIDLVKFIIDHPPDISSVPEFQLEDRPKAFSFQCLDRGRTSAPVSPQTSGSSLSQSSSSASPKLFSGSLSGGMTSAPGWKRMASTQKKSMDNNDSDDDDDDDDWGIDYVNP